MNEGRLWLISRRCFCDSNQPRDGRQAMNAVLMRQILLLRANLLGLYQWPNLARSFASKKPRPARLGRNGDGAPDSVRCAARSLTSALGAPVALIGPASSPEQFDPISGQAVERHAARQAEHWHRVAHELEAVTTGTAQATQKILTAAGRGDRSTGEQSRRRPQRQNRARPGAGYFRDLVIQIFEACNFQGI